MEERERKREKAKMDRLLGQVGTYDTSESERLLKELISSCDARMNEPDEGTEL